MLSLFSTRDRITYFCSSCSDTGRFLAFVGPPIDVTETLRSELAVADSKKIILENSRNPLSFEYIDCCIRTRTKCNTTI